MLRTTGLVIWFFHANTHDLCGHISQWCMHIDILVDNSYNRNIFVAFADSSVRLCQTGCANLLFPCGGLVEEIITVNWGYLLIDRVSCSEAVLGLFGTKVSKMGKNTKNFSLQILFDLCLILLPCVRRSYVSHCSLTGDFWINLNLSCSTSH